MVIESRPGGYYIVAMAAYTVGYRYIHGQKQSPILRYPLPQAVSLSAPKSQWSDGAGVR